MNIPILFIIAIVILMVILYISKKIFSHSVVNTNDKSFNIILLVLLFTTIITISGTVFSAKYISNKIATIEPAKGETGERGIRGPKGKDTACGLKCNDDAGYNKVMDHISNVYNLWCETTGNTKLKPGRYIENIYIRRKVKEIVKSDIFENLLQLHGAHKLDIRGNPFGDNEKCDINSNCGAYDYLFQKWTEWILIILKYKNGYIFLNSKHMTDNDFNTLLVDEDINHSEEVTKQWVFKIIDDDTNEEISMMDILSSPNNNNNMEIHKERDRETQKQKQIFKKSQFYKFYNFDGVPSVYNAISDLKNRNITETKSKLVTLIKSPFEEIGDYDSWYWGANPLSKPKLINKCTYDVKNNEKFKQYKIKVKLSNDYDIVWESKNARQERINYIIDNAYTKIPSSGDFSNLVYVPNNLKGNKSVVVLRPKIFTDISEENLDFKTYYPLGHVIADAANIDRKTSNNQCYPRYINNTFDTKPVDYTKNGSKKITLLVSGDVKNPVDFIKIYQSLRSVGFDSNMKGYTFWRPLPPKGYVALGDIIDVSPTGEKPSLDTIKCIPEDCVEIFNNYDIINVYDTEDGSTSYNGNIEKKLPKEITNGEVIDTDRLTDEILFKSPVNNSIPTEPFNENDENNLDKLKGYLEKYNLFRGIIGSKTDVFYKIKDEYLYDDTNKTQTFKDNIIKQPKFSKNYSILKIYE